jgi:hypothetical protein
MSLVTLPTEPTSFVHYGDLDVLTPSSVDNGTGSIFIRNGALLVAGLTELGETTIETGDGPLTVEGSNLISMNVSAAIQMTAAAASYFDTTSSTLSFSASDTTTGKVSITGAGLGADTVLIQATNATSGQIDIKSLGGSTTIAPIVIQATDTTNGYVNLTGAGSFAAGNPAVKISSTNADSQIQILSAGDATGTTAIDISATGTTGGNIKITGAGSFGSSVPAVWITSPHATGGKVLIEGNSTATDSIIVRANNGGISIDAADQITIDTSDTTTGIIIGATASVPVTIGSTGSATTIAGNLTVLGATTTISTVSLVVEDNVVILNSGAAVAGIDAGIAIRRYQAPNDVPEGDVQATTGPIQESGAFIAGSSTPATLVLPPYASPTDDFYNGWWIKITSGTGIGQVRRVKDYVGSTNTITVFIGTDNVGADPGPVFTDGLDLATAPASADTYELFSSSYSATFYDESDNKWQFYTVAQPDVIGITQTSLQQSQDIVSGAIDVVPKIYNNARATASTTVITITLLNHGFLVGDYANLSNSSALTPALADDLYLVITVPTANTFTVTAPASTVSTTASSITVESYKSSIIRVNVIEPYTPGVSIVIPNFNLIDYIDIPKLSTATFTVPSSGVYGAYTMYVGDNTNFTGAYAVFSLSSSQNGGSISRLSGSKGSDGQRLNATWDAAGQIQIFQQVAGVGAGNYTYKVRLITLL